MDGDRWWADHAASVAALHEVEVFDMDAPCVRAFTRSQFDHDGYYLWPGLLTAAGRDAVQAACMRIQQLQDDRWLGAEWESIPASEWETRGLHRPKHFLTEEEKDRCRGGSQLGGTPSAEPIRDFLPPRNPSAQAEHLAGGWNPPRLMPVLQGYIPESFPAGYGESVRAA